MTIIGRTKPKAPEPEVIEQPNEAEDKPKKSKKDDAK